MRVNLTRWRKTVIAQIVAALEEYPNSQPVAGLLLDERAARQSFRPMITRSLIRAEIEGARLEMQYIDAIGGKQTAAASAVKQIAAAPQEIDPFDILVGFNDQMRQAVAAFASEREVGIWNSVSIGTRAALEEAIRESLELGLQIREMGQYVQSVLTHYDKRQSQTVARTEATGAMNNGANVAMIDAEVPYHQWLRTIDRRTRGFIPTNSPFDHYRAAQTVPLAQPFSVSGQLLRFPGDTSLGATAGNVVNCRCSAAAKFDA
jgi:hypothetical protein